jgi:hypothetical protein
MITRSIIILAILGLFAACGGGGGGGGGGGTTPSVEEKKPPVAQTGPDQTVAEGSVVTLDASNSTDPDDGIASYGWEQTGGPAVTLSDASVVKPTFTAPNVSVGGAALTFKLTVTDNGGLKSTATCIVNVTWENEPPTATTGPDQTISEGSSVTLDASNSTDWDDGIASYGWEQTGGPAVTLSDISAVKPTFTAPNVGIGGAALTFKLTVTDNGGLKSTATCIVNVTWDNKPPIAITGPDQTVAEGSVVTLDASNSTDPDDGIASYGWEQTEGPAVTLLPDASAIQPTFTAPNVDENGAALKFELTVTDNGGLKSTITCIVNITGVNEPPAAVVGPTQTVGELVQVTLDGSNSIDPENGSLSYAWQQTGGKSVTLSNASIAKPTFTTPTVGTAGEALTFELTVTDQGGLQSSATCIVNVTWRNKPPKAEAGLNQTVEDETVVTLDGTGSTDPDDNIASYLWQQTTGISVTLSNAADAQPSFTAPNVGPKGAVLTFRLTVTDKGGLKASDTCTVTIQRNPAYASAHLLEDTLYTAYAGIGYGSENSTADDEPFYNIMLDDLNAVAGDFVINTIFNDPNVLNKLLFGVLLGLTTTFDFTNSSGVVSSVKFNPGPMVNGYRSFQGDLSVSFSPTGYAWDSCQYFSDSGGIDLTASVTGYFKATSAGLDELFLSSVTIEAKNTLIALYPIGEVTYNQWKIAYQVYYGEVDPTYTSGGSTIPVNAKILPILISEPLSKADFRDYTLSGGFVINGKAYSLSPDGIRYRQYQYDYPENGTTVSKTLLSLSGKLTPPGQTDVVTISTPEDIIDPVGSNTIIRNISGIWISGLMNFSGISSASKVSFNNGSCTFSGGDQGTWSVTGWQNNLKP